MKEQEIKSVTIAANIVTPHTETAIKDIMTIIYKIHIYEEEKKDLEHRQYLCSSERSPIEHNILPAYELRRKRNGLHPNNFYFSQSKCGVNRDIFLNYIF